MRPGEVRARSIRLLLVVLAPALRIPRRPCRVPRRPCLGSSRVRHRDAQRGFAAMRVPVEVVSIYSAEGYVLAQRDGRLVVIRSTASPGIPLGGPKNKRLRNVGGR